MFARFFDWFTNLAGYQKGYAAGREEAKLSVTHANKTVYETARDNGMKSGYGDGFRKGEREGFETGKAAGTRAGIEQAFTVACRELSLHLPPEVDREIILDDPDTLRRLDTGPHANVYISPGAVELRVIIGGELHVEMIKVPFEKQNPKKEHSGVFDGLYHRWMETAPLRQALLQLLRKRNMLLNQPLSPVESWSSNTLDDCIASRLPPSGLQSPDVFYLENVKAIAREYHRRRTEIDLLRCGSTFLGEDPAVRLPDADPQILWRPWPRLFPGVVPKRVREAFMDCGLGDVSGRYAPARSLRDVLLFRGEEFRQTEGFGERSLESLRQLLADSGLYLWGDEPPQPSPNNPAVRQRAMRNITWD